MSNTHNTAARIVSVRAIGAGIRKTDTNAALIVDALPEGFDPKERGAVAAFVSTWINGDADAPAQKTGPKGDQTLTDYGRGFAALVSAVKRALSEPKAKTETLTVSYIDADGATHSVQVTRDEDATLYANLTSLALRDTPNN